MDFAGEFETHLALAHVDADVLTNCAARHSLKCTAIVLDRGANPSQPMLTRRGTGTLASEIRRAHELRDALEMEGFQVVRVKIEANPTNAGVPRTDEQALADPTFRCFEHHVKLLLEHDADLNNLIAIAERHSARLSRNAFRSRDDGRQERFVTQRCHGVGLPRASARLQALVDDLGARHCILDVEEEYVVYDSNADLDAGWLEE